jgi:hypothetical protein
MLHQETKHQICECREVDRVRVLGRDTEGKYEKSASDTKANRTSGVPYERLLWNAVSDDTSYFSAKPKSTRTGMFLWEMSMLAGLIMLIGTIKGSDTGMNSLDVIMNDASCVQEFDTGEKEVEPLAGF